MECAPSYAMAYCHLRAGESVSAESGAMALMSQGVSLSAGTGGGVLKGFVRKALGGESFFLGRYTASVHGAWVAFAPKFPGDIAVVDLSVSGSIVTESGSMLAFDDGVEVSVTNAGVGNVLMREGITMLRMAGSGTVLLCSYGGLQQFELSAGQSVVVDTGHVVAFSETMERQVGMVAGVAASAASGEGLGMKLSGPGHVWVQTRAEQALTSWLFPDRKQNRG